MGPLCARLRGLRSPRTPTVFESLIDSIIEQQISLPAAQSIERRLVERTGRSVELEGFRYFAFPSPAAMARVLPEDLRECGLSRRKTEYVLGISQSIVTGTLDLEGLASVTDTPEVISRLMEVRRVGRWTAELTRCAGSPGTMPSLRKISASGRLSRIFMPSRDRLTRTRQGRSLMPGVHERGLPPSI
jgi:DNA-3-methyladenine glycosylase II